MKYLNILVFTALILSCSTSKKVVQPNKEVKPIIETVKDTTANSFSLKEPVIKIEKKTEILEDTITTSNQFHQEVRKRTGSLHMLWDELLQKHVSNQGNVNYKAFKNSQKDLLGYISVLQKLYPKLDMLPQDEKLAYWINAYNAMTIDLILRHYPISSIKDIDKPWKQRYWKLGDKWYNLDEIEHQIIRKMGEPRIHFALVCAAKSCPKLYNKAFTADNLDNSLTKLTEEFLNDTSKNTITENKLELSKIFSWFAKDFKQNGSLIDFLNRYTEIEISLKAKKSFNTYNWELNE